MVKGLEAKGLLPKALEYAANRTAEATSSLLQNGVPPQQAAEKMRQEWAFLPSEADVPELPNGDPEKWLATSSSTEASSSPPEATAPA